MQTFIAMLRGINVSGQKKIKMADLQKLFESLGFQNVQTYIQSGNVVFESKESPQTIVKLIEEKIKDQYGWEVPVIVREKEELKKVSKSNPFIKEGKYPDRLYVTFLGKKPSVENLKKLDGVKYSPEEFILEGTNIYFYAPNGYGRAKMNNNFFENKLKVTATTRNWKTVNKLVEMAEGSAG